jgi:DNA-binding IclR family transcriptional regulator
VVTRRLDNREAGPSPAAGFPLEGAAVKSARRTLEVFEFFAEHQAPASEADLVRTLGYPQSSTSALLKSLVDLGYLEYRRDTRLYVPTLRIALLGGWLHDSVFGDTGLVRVVQSVHEQTGGVAALGQQNGVFAQYVLTMRSDGPRVHMRTGPLRPICRSAIGRALLSAKPDSEAVKVLRGANARERDPRQRLTQAELLKALALCRKLGYAHTEATVSPGRAVIAMLLPPLRGHSRMALGIGGPVDEIRKSRSRIVAVMHAEIATLAPPVL